MHRINEERAECYVKYILDKANFANTVDNVDVDMELVIDSVVRKHVKVTTTCRYNTPFGQILEGFGMDSASTYQVTACADCTDMADYISTVSFGEAVAKGKYLEDTGFPESLVGMINSFIGLYNKIKG